MTAAATLATLRSEAHASVSAISAFLACPKQYAYRYVHRSTASHRPAALAFGTAVHEALADFYGGLMCALEPPATRLEEVFVAAWRRELGLPTPVLLDDSDTPDSLEAKGREMLGVFHREAPRPYRVVDIERPFTVTLADPTTGQPLPVPLIGAFDVVVQDENGRHRILEHKAAGARTWTQERLAFDSQVTAYSLVALLIGLGDVPVTLQLLLKTKQARFETHTLSRTERDHRDFLELAAGVLRAAKAGAFYPVRDWHCRGCGFAYRCVTGDEA